MDLDWSLNYVIYCMFWSKLLNFSETQFPLLSYLMDIEVVTGRMKAPKDVYTLSPGICEYVTLHGKRDFAGYGL